jgi:triosephosphate isomerase
MQTPTLLVGNWKMNLIPSEAARYASAMREQLPELRKTEVWVAPMTVSLAHVAHELRGSTIRVGAQNSHWATSGAFTGETALPALRDLGAQFTILGHSERRTYFGETSESVAQRMVAALKAGITPVVCIGETDSERTSGKTEQILSTQLLPIFAQLSPETAAQVILAYEPVWAIGTGKVASEKEIEDTHGYILSLWREQGYAREAAILYGGSVSPQNFAGIVRLPGVRGALVGGASIKLDQWLELVSISESAD